MSNIPENPKVGIIMGSASDLKVMNQASELLDSFNLPYEMTVVSAHRTPLRMFQYAQTARERGLKIIIAGAGGAAHLPGMVASITTLPVIGVPILSSNSIDGWDSVLSILQMPAGIPVATVALDGAKNAALLAVRILANDDPLLHDRLINYQKELEHKVMLQVEEMENKNNTNM